MVFTCTVKIQLTNVNFATGSTFVSKYMFLNSFKVGEKYLHLTAKNERDKLDY